MSQLLPLIVFLLCLFSFSGQASAQSRWKVSAIDVNDRIYYVDEHLTIQSDGNILGWKKAELPPNSDYPPGSYSVIRSEWNCSNRRNRYLQFLVYDRFGNFIEQVEIDTGWRDNAPNSIGEVITNDVCSVLKNRKKNSSRNTTPAGAFAQITARNVNLMSDAGPNSEVIRKVAIGEKLTLVSEKPVGVWYRVLDAKTNSEGWLNGYQFKIVKAVKPAGKGRRSNRRQ